MSTISPRGPGLILGRRSRTATDSYGTRPTGRSRADPLRDGGLDPCDRNRPPPGFELEGIDLPEHEAQRTQDGGAIAQLAHDHLRRRGRHGERATVERGPDRIEQDVSGRAQRASDDDPAWVQEVAEVGDLHADQPPRV